MKRLTILFMLLSLILTACGGAGADATPTVDSALAATSAFSTAFAELTQTAVAGATATPSVTPTLTPAPPTDTATPMPTMAPVQGIAHTPVTVRSEPRKGSDNVGGVAGNQGVQVIARNDAGSWFYIRWKDAPTGAAWVLAAAITLQGADLTQLPIAVYDTAHNVVVFPPLIWTLSGAPLPLNPPAAGAITGTVTQLCKVRVGPGIGFSVMSTIGVGSVVALTGHLADNSWLQIDYPSGPGGKGWVSSDLIKTAGPLAGLQFYNLLATPVSEEDAKNNGGAPTANAASASIATPTVAPTLAGPPGVVNLASQINVHSGPASTFDTLGTLNLGDKVVVTGETINKLWYRILYPSGPNGYGWVSTHYIRITGGDMTKLPFFDTQGNPLP